MNEENIAEIWTLFKEYVDKKQIELVAEKYIDLMADYGISDETLKDCLGVDSALDDAIYYYLDEDGDETFDDDDEEWDE